MKNNINYSGSASRLIMALLFVGVIGALPLLGQTSRAHNMGNGDLPDETDMSQSDYEQSNMDNMSSQDNDRHYRNDADMDDSDNGSSRPFHFMSRTFNLPNEYIIRGDVPGYKKDDIKATLDNGMVMITGQRQENDDEKKIHSNDVQGVYKSFTGRVRLPADADPNDIHLDVHEGVLWLHIKRMDSSKQVG